MGQLKMDISGQANQLSIQFAGEIDEDTDFSKIKFDGFTSILFDWGGVTSINSCGIREWVRWAAKLPITIRVSFKNCPRVIVNQMCMVNGFLPKQASLESFYVPFFCDQCETVKAVLFTQGKEFTGENVNPPKGVTCDKCQKPVEMDIIPAKYFRFLRKSLDGLQRI